LGPVAGADPMSAAAAAPPLLLLNGIGFNAELMEPLADTLPSRTIVCPDMPGCGGSPDPAVPYLMPRLAAAMVALMERRFPGQAFDCLGFSWGGALGQQIAVQAPRQMDRLMLISTNAGLPLPMGDLGIWNRLLDPTEYADPQRLSRNFRQLLREGGANAGLMRRFTSPSAAGALCQIGALAGWSAAPLLPFLRMPVLLIGVGDDAIVPIVHQQALACFIPQAETMELPSGGHLTPLASPEQISTRIAAFLDRAPRRLAA